MGIERLVSADNPKVSVLSKFDGHVHSWHSYDVAPYPELSPLAIYEKSLKNGMNFVTITDHDTIASHKELDGMPGFMPGVEISIKDRQNVGFTIHTNIYGLNAEQFADLENLAGRTINREGYADITHDGNLPGFVDYLKSAGLHQFSCYNHPFWFERGEVNFLIPINRIREIMKMFPVAELNGHRYKFWNLLTLDMAEEENKGVVASSDTHSARVGRIYTAAEGDNFEEFYGNVRSNGSCLVAGHMDANALRYEVKEFLDMVFRRNIRNPRQKIMSGNSLVDRLADALLHGETDSFKPIARKAVEIAAYAANNTRILPAIYVMMQEYKDRRLLQQSLQMSA